MNSLFEFLFKYTPVMFNRGALATSAAVPSWILALAGVLAIALVIWTYSRATSLRARDRVLLISLRSLAIAVLCVCLARPVLVVSEAIPQRNVVGIVVDDSRSMQIADTDSLPRAQRVVSLVGGKDSALVKALSDRFQVRFFRTSGAGGRSSDLTGLHFDASRTKLVPALMRAEDELAGAPVAGLVLLSDGADNSSTIAGESPISQQILALRARGVPVYTVGIGQEQLKRDIEIARVDAPRTVLKDGALAIDVVMTQRGYAGRKVDVVVEDNGRIVGTRPVTLPRDGEAVVTRLRVPTSERGARSLTVRVPVQPAEMVAENNERHTLVTVRDRREKILYLEGEPRFELKFIRRAVEDDANLQLVTLLRSAKDKFLRLSVDDSVELATGFPTTREELFAYRAIVLGSIEASFFTVDQLRMLADFVNVRGGGLLALGGRRALAEGGYAGTPLADVLPVDLAAGLHDSTTADEVAVVPTSTGVVHPAMQLAGTDSGTAVRWTTMPHLTVVNHLGRAKPGATILLEGVPVAPEQRGRLPLLSFQRFGRGKAAVFAVQDSWLWQMSAEVAVEDLTHETFWRQVLRWLASDVPDRVEVVAPDASGPGEGITLRATVSDAAYVRANGAAVQAGVGADGQPLSMEWAADRDGEYRTTVVPDGEGIQELHVRAVVGRDTLRADPAYVRVATPTTEFFGASLRRGLLQQVAEETGGRYYDAADALQVARDVVYSASGATVVQRLDLWDMPVIFALLLLLLGAEWWWRRQRGLA
ncbi:MAG: glutamine amidotransferase [Gemmatimonadaceae bacterium]